MERIILFRFHKDPVICKNRLRLLKRFNPDIQIFGLYGGPEKDYKKFQKKLKFYLGDIYCIQGKTASWKWRNGDLAIRLWYKKIGKTLSFDMLHVVEWDLLLFDSLDKIYKDIPKDGVGLTALTLLKKVERDWPWVSKEPHKSEWNALLNFVRDKFNYNQEPYTCKGPALCLPKRFLERYSSIEIPELCNDELRLSLFSQIFGFKLYDTCFYKRWSNESEKEFFNCDGHEINLSIISKELVKYSGRRVFHPFQRILIFNCIDYEINLSNTIEELVKFFTRRVFHLLKNTLPGCEGLIVNPWRINRTKQSQI